MKNFVCVVLVISAILTNVQAQDSELDIQIAKALAHAKNLEGDLDIQRKLNAKVKTLKTEVVELKAENQQLKQTPAPSPAQSTVAVGATETHNNRQWTKGRVYPIRDNDTGTIYRATYVGDDVQGRNGLSCKSLEAVTQDSSEIGIQWKNFRTPDGSGYYRYSVGSCGGAKRFQRAYGREFPALAVMILSFEDLPKEQWPNAVHHCTCDQHPQRVVEPRVVETPRVVFREEERIVARRESCEPVCQPRIPCGQTYTYSSGGCPRYEACGPYRQECRPQVYQYPHSCGRQNQYYQPQSYGQNLVGFLGARFGFGGSAYAGFQGNGGQQYRYRSF